MLLFWPRSWGLALANSTQQNTNLFIHFLILFFIGSILMRSAGCIFNDIVDKDYDKKVKRTKQRPIASNKITISRALIYVSAICFLAFIILIQFNLFTIFFGDGIHDFSIYLSVYETNYLLAPIIFGNYL